MCGMGYNSFPVGSDTRKVRFRANKRSKWVFWGVLDSWKCGMFSPWKWHFILSFSASLHKLAFILTWSKKIEKNMGMHEIGSYNACATQNLLFRRRKSIFRTHCSSCNFRGSFSLGTIFFFFLWQKIFPGTIFFFSSAFHVKCVEKKISLRSEEKKNIVREGKWSFPLKMGIFIDFYWVFSASIFIEFAVLACTSLHLSWH